MADVLGKLVDGVDEGPPVDLRPEGVDGALLGEGCGVEVGEDVSGDGSGLGDDIGDGPAGAPEVDLTVGVDLGHELGVPLPANVFARQTLGHPPSDDPTHVGGDGCYGVGVGVQGFPVDVASGGEGGSVVVRLLQQHVYEIGVAFNFGGPWLCLHMLFSKCILHLLCDPNQLTTTPGSYFESLSTSGPGPSNRVYAKVSLRERGQDTPHPDSALETLRPGSGRAESLPLDSRSESGMTEVGVYYSGPFVGGPGTWSRRGL